MKKMKLVLTSVLSMIAMCGLVACGGQTSSANASGNSGYTSSEKVSSSKTSGTPTSSADGGNKETGTQDADSFKVTYDLNYEGAPAANVVTVAKDDAAPEPEAPTRDCYRFTGWFEDASCTTPVDFENAIVKDVTYYAGWELTAVTVTFNLNYEGATSETVNVEIGGTVSQPTSPVRAGFIFDGWYADAEGNTPFDFATAINETTVIYAKWSVDDGNNITITYMWNYTDGGTYDTVTIAKNKKTTSPMPTRDGYYFEGWYTEAECVNKFDFTVRLNESYTLYAHWMGIYTFEAEYTNLDGLEGMGYSGNASGVKMITKDDESDPRNASNGYYVGWLYNNGLQLKFDIESDAACSNAILNLSLSAEFYDITLTDTTFTVAVNDTALDYSDIEFKNAGTSTLQFVSYMINSSVSLNQGSNTVTLTVTNTEKKTGTIYASAPMVDCMTIYSDTTLSWTPKTSNISNN